MLYIGFANKYYTLWDVETFEYEKQGEFGTKYHCVETLYNYYQNLSYSLEKAKEKAPDALVDLGLSGSKSYSKTTRTYVDNGKDTIVDFGKYKGQSLQQISENDHDYFQWLCGNCHNQTLFEIIANNFEIPEEEEREEIDFLEAGFVEIILDGGPLYDDTMIAYHGNLTLDVHFPETKEYYYNGYSYNLPTVNGKGKRIKNKKIKIIGIVSEPKDKLLNSQQIDVQSFEIV